MYTARVLTNETCNQRCAFCTARRPQERASFAAAPAVLARLDAALRDGAKEVVLTGGEPTLRRDLPAFVAYARRAGAARVTLETNGALLDASVAEALCRAGLDVARVHMPCWGEALDAITGDEGGFARAKNGIAALAAAGIAVEIAAPVIRANAAMLPDIPRAIAASGLTITGLCLAVPVTAPRGNDNTLLPLEGAARVLESVATAAREVGIAVRLDPGSIIPPCLFPRPGRVAHLFSLTRGGADRPDFMRAPACSRCSLRDRCPGFPSAAIERAPELLERAAPIDDDRIRRRLSLVSTVAEQVARELCTRDVRRDIAGATVRENIVRVNFHCNQACRFCFVSTHLPPAAHDAIVAAIEEIAAERGVLSLSGGEPTLNPRLVEYVRLGKRLGVCEIELQTNAIRLSDPAFTSALWEAGVDTFFVSLHAPTAEVSDAITEAPGTFEKTALGIDAIARTGAALRLNYVFCEANQALFPDYVKMVSARWPRAHVTVSFVAPSTDVVPRERSLIPRYSEVMPALAEGIRLAKQAGLRLLGYESMCGVPLCQVPDDVSSYMGLAEIPEGVDRGEFIKAEVCERCDLGRRCFGVRRGYAELHGTSELRAVRLGAVESG